MRRVVFAIGGNSLIPEGYEGIADYDIQRRTLNRTIESISLLIRNHYQVVITHGNGPQVGYHLLRSYYTSREHGFPEIPLDVCNALTQAEIGYMIVQELRRVTSREASVVLTRVLVSEKDAAFKNPTKPVGPEYSEEEKKRIELQTGWKFKKVEDGRYRRIVPSPRPIRIIEGPLIRKLVEGNTIVVCCGGGGIPVVEGEDGLRGVHAVIDKDRVSALLGSTISADTFIITTSVDAVYLNYRKPEQRKLREVSIGELRRYLDEGHFGEGSMKPKIESAIEFIENGGEKVIITSPYMIEDAIEGREGTLIHE